MTLATDLNQFQLQATVERWHEIEGPCPEGLGKGSCPMCFAYALGRLNPK